MTYVDRINAFWNWNETHDISHPAVVLYFSLLDFANTARWNQPVAIPNSRIIGKINMSERELNRNRNKLVQCGLISYKNGKKGQAGKYEILDLTTCRDVSNNVSNNVHYNDMNTDMNTDVNSVSNNVHINRERGRGREREDITPYSPPKRKDIVKEVVELYNSVCKSLPRVSSISDARRKAVKARLNKYSMEQFREVFKKAESSDFLKGANNRNWQANFDWLMKDGNFAKTLDGNYDNRGVSDTANDSCMSGTDNISEIERQFMGCYGG